MCIERLILSFVWRPEHLSLHEAPLRSASLRDVGVVRVTHGGLLVVLCIEVEWKALDYESISSLSRDPRICKAKLQRAMNTNVSSGTAYPEAISGRNVSLLVVISDLHGSSWQWTGFRNVEGCAICNGTVQVLDSSLRL